MTLELSMHSREQASRLALTFESKLTVRIINSIPTYPTPSCGCGLAPHFAPHSLLPQTPPTILDLAGPSILP
jgi:hypothetical protein